MPYIKLAARKEIDDGRTPETAGELNYLLTVTCLDFLDHNGWDYQSFNDIVGALEGCKLELYRRIIAPYEDGKIEENGDVG